MKIKKGDLVLVDSSLISPERGGCTPAYRKFVEVDELDFGGTGPEGDGPMELQGFWTTADVLGYYLIEEVVPPFQRVDAGPRTL